MTDTPPEPPARLAPAPVPAGWEDILDPGETILWQGRPDGQVVWGNLLSFQTVFGAFFAGFAIFWMAMAFGISGGSPVSLIFPLFGLPFLFIGLYLSVGHVFWAAYRRRHTYYTLTDRNAFIATEIRGRRKLEQKPLRADMKLKIEDGSPGTVWFDENVVHTPGGFSGHGKNRRYRGPSTQITPIGFERIDEPRRVFRLLRDALPRAEAPSQDERE